MVSQALNRSTAKVSKALLRQQGTIEPKNYLLAQTNILNNQIEKQQQISTQARYHQVQLKKKSNPTEVATKEVYDLYKSQKFQTALNKANELASLYPDVPWLDNVITTLNMRLKNIVFFEKIQI